jgi:hypothetical protein
MPKMPQKTTFLVFSKNRPLQLKSLLLSIGHFSDIEPADISVIYDADEKFSYAPLMERFACRFVKERKGAFLGQVREIIASTDSPYFGFMVDDLILRRPVSLKHIESLLDRRPDILSFSLRMGMNITVGGSQPEPIREDGEFIVWDTARGLGSYWNYFWDISSSIYRRDIVTTYLGKCRPHRECYPNPLEFHFYSCMPNTSMEGPPQWIKALIVAGRKPLCRVAAYRHSAAFTYGINFVIPGKRDQPHQHSVEELQELVGQGYMVNFRGLEDAEVDQPNQGTSNFSLALEEQPEVRPS